MSQGFSGNPAAAAFGNLLPGPGFDADEAAVGAAFAAGLAAAGFAPAFADALIFADELVFADSLVFADTAAAFGLALAVGAFGLWLVGGLSGLAGFAAVLALAVAGAVVLGVFATRPSLDRSCCLRPPRRLRMTETSSVAAGTQEIQPVIYVLRLSAAVQVCPCGKLGRNRPRQ
ncbi:conserved membrane hypothetical protein [Mesorhizobium prunaredense]|uniref:Uncharacterized protein n=1 Tax=Mesorhizobium prunaredense TaxID=1631249 RepID=A0A1R3V5K3_9HYPH|nr:hypothetical protein [Mesorhizobium prunaredense]SIT55151.1 conserved membrane hypothetical protein [Mesorhizobium prunaredense]